MFDNIIIGMVLHESLTGYDIKKEIEISVGNFYKVSYGSLYPALKKLTDKGLLTMREEAQGGRVKKYYTATDLGRKEFMAWLESSTMDSNTGSDALMIKLYFIGELPKDVRNQQLLECEMHCRMMQRQLEEIEKEVKKEQENGEMNDVEYFKVSTLYFGLNNIHNIIKWLAHIREQRPLPEFLQNKESES